MAVFLTKRTTPSGARPWRQKPLLPLFTDARSVNKAPEPAICRFRGLASILAALSAAPCGPCPAQARMLCPVER